MKAKKHIWDWRLRRVKKNWFSVLMGFLILIFFLINYTALDNKLNTEGGDMAVVYRVLYIMISVILTIVVWLMSRKLKEKENNYQKIFVVFAIILGAVYLCLSPFFTGSDEHNHYYRIYEITEGVVQTPVGEDYTGGRLPVSLNGIFGIGHFNNKLIKYSDSLKMMEVPLNGDEVMVYDSRDNSTCYASASLYSPISYIPHIVGVSTGKVLGVGSYYIGMLGRLFNLIFYIVIGYFAIKLIPKGKLFYLLILLSPNMMQLATTLSADAFMNVIFMLLLAVIMKVRLGEEKMTRGKQFLVAGISIVISLCKICYVPLVALVLTIRKNQYQKGAKEKYVYVTVVLSLAVICSLIWVKNTGQIFDVAYPQAVAQKDFILSNPLSYLIILARSIMNTFVSSIECLFVGTTMYHSQLIIPAIVSLFYTGLVSIAILKKDKMSDVLLTKVEKAAIMGVCLTMIVLILTALYLQCTSQLSGVGGLVVMGIQGRYFIPIVLCLPFVISLKRKRKVDERKLIISSMAVTLVVWFYMMNQFII